MGTKPNPAFELTEADVPLVATLPFDAQQILATADSTGGNYSVMSAELGICIGTVKSRLNRARRRLIALREASTRKEAA